MSKIKYLMLLCVVMSCSTMTKHFIKKGQLEITGGNYKTQVWDQSLVFERVTWYREFTAMFDLNMVKVDQKSPFFSWFSPEEKAKIRKSVGPCYITMAYQEDSKKLSKIMLMEQLKTQGFEKININHFGKFLKVHPQAGEFSLHQYEICGMCADKQIEKILIDFPGFQTVNI